jgi:hypothetical protein
VTPVLPLRSREMLLFAALAWFTAGGAGTWWLLRRRRAGALLAAGGVVLALGLAAAAAHAMREPPTRVLLEATTLRAAPNPQAEVLAGLGAGAGVHAVGQQNGWVRVRTGTGLEGWLEAELAGRILVP